MNKSIFLPTVQYCGWLHFPTTITTETSNGKAEEMKRKGLMEENTRMCAEE